MNLEIILSVIVAMFIYDIVLKAIGSVLLKHSLTDEDKKQVRKTFQERIEEKKKERDN